MSLNRGRTQAWNLARHWGQKVYCLFLSQIFEIIVTSETRECRCCPVAFMVRMIGGLGVPSVGVHRGLIWGVRTPGFCFSWPLICYLMYKPNKNQNVLLAGILRIGDIKKDFMTTPLTSVQAMCHLSCKACHICSYMLSHLMYATIRGGGNCDYLTHQDMEAQGGWNNLPEVGLANSYVHYHGRTVPSQGWFCRTASFHTVWEPGASQP